MKRFNDWLALKITNGVSTMWCAYAFAVLAIFGFPGFHATLGQFVQWLSQTFIQLTMLSILAVASKLLSDKHEKLSKTHDSTHALIKEIHRQVVRKK